MYNKNILYDVGYFKWIKTQWFVTLRQNIIEKSRERMEETSSELAVSRNHFHSFKRKKAKYEDFVICNRIMPFHINSR